MRTIGDLVAILQSIDANIEIENALQDQEMSTLFSRGGENDPLIHPRSLIDLKHLSVDPLERLKRPFIRL